MSVLSAGAVVDRYEVMGWLGQGNMAHVYLVRHRALGSEHVLKVLKAASAAGRDRLLREGQVQARLKHPNVVEVTDVIEVGGAPALVMERVEGPSLDRVLAAGRLPREQVDALVPGICAGLAAAHAFGVVHRDLKPANVLLQLRGDAVIPKIADFGLVKFADRDAIDAQTATAATMGTPVYMAPEQIHGTRDVDARADVWALGAMLYELATGRRAFRGLTLFAVFEAVASLRFVSPEQADPTLPSRWVDAIGACLRPVEARAGSVEAVFAAWSGGAGLGDARREIAWSTKALERLRAQAPSPPPELRPAVESVTYTDAHTHVHPSTHVGSISRIEAGSTPERDAFVGRAAELNALAQRVEAGARLVTVLGFGGAGKTRLVSRFGRLHASRFPGGVWLCELAEARDEAGIVEGVARALEVPLGAGDPVVQLGHAIAGRGRCLLLLDNTEQVTSGAASVLGRWLDRAGEAVLLVTSREVLGLPGEHVFSLDPLPAEDGIALFVARARQAKQGFVADDPASIAALVGLLDGLPLAIELAAARVRAMSPAALLARMLERFRLLASAGGRPPRHATLRATLDASWELLSDDERLALSQLAVFEGGFTLEAAEAVLALEGMWPVDAVQALVDKSLVRVSSADRFELLMSVRDYAAEHLDALGARAGAEARHGSFFARYGSEEAIEALHLVGGGARRRALRTERANLSVATRRAVTRQAGDTAVATARAAWALLSLEGPYSEARSLAEAVYAMPGLSPKARVRATAMLGAVLRILGLGRPARTHLESALALAREIGDEGAASHCLGELATLHHREGRLSEARACAERSAETDNRRLRLVQRGNLAIWDLDQRGSEHSVQAMRAAIDGFREIGDLRNEGIAWGGLGNHCSRRGARADAQACYELALARARELGDRRNEGTWLGNVGTELQAQGLLGEARVHYERALTLAREIGDRLAESAWLGNLGILALEQGRHGDASVDLDRAVVIAREVGAHRYEGVWLGSRGAAHLAEGRRDEARVDLDAGEALLRAAGDEVELEKLLCRRAYLEIEEEREDDALATLAEVEGLARTSGVRDESELARALLAARRHLVERQRRDRTW